MCCFAVSLDECLLVAYINSTWYQRINSPNEVKIQSFSARPMLMESQGMIRSPQNNSGAKQHYNIV